MKRTDPRYSGYARPILLMVLMAFGLLASCEKNETPPGPLNDGSCQRTQIVVISDLHLGADLTYAEFNKNGKALADFLGLVRKSPTVKELVIAGDFVDEWFVPATIDTYAGKDQADFVNRIALANKAVIDAFKRIIREGNILVTYVPGNHDLNITAANIENMVPGISQARDDVQGLGTYYPQNHPEIAIEHGHRYNFFCAPDPLSNSGAEPGSILPAGYFFTRIGALHVLQNCKVAVDSVRTVTPNPAGGESQAQAYAYWLTWKNLILSLPIENKFDEKIIVTHIGGFTQTYSVNDLLPFQLTPGGTIDMNLYKASMENWDQRQSVNHVPFHSSALQAIIDAPGVPPIDAQATLQYFSNPASNARIVVFGHTHEPKIIASENHAGLKSIYANSGTWIDHNPDRTTMNFVVITPQATDATSGTRVKLYNFEKEIFTEMAVDSLR